MTHINDIASWFSKNNEFCSEDQDRIKLLSLMAILFFKHEKLPLEYSELYLKNNNFEFGIYDYDTDYHFSKKELFLLNVVNREFGYILFNVLVSYFELDYPTIDKLYDRLKDVISSDIEGYGEIDFNTYTYINKNDMIFFIDNNIELTDELKEKLDNKLMVDGQYIFNVTTIPNGRVVIF